MGEWRVDPDGVLGVLAAVDDQGPTFESAYSGIDDAATSASALQADGRTVLSDAWTTFMSSRRLVPGKIMHSISAAAGAVGRATVAVVAGDDEMSSDTQQAEQHAEDAWGIAQRGAYISAVTQL